MKRRILWFALILTAIIGLVWPMLPIASSKARLTSLPSAGLDFHSVTLPLSPEDRAFLGDAQAAQHLISLRSGGKLILTIIDGTRNRHAVHDPAYCFSGAGWQISAKNPVKLSSGTAMRVSLEKADEKTEALWFFDDGKQQFASPVDYWFKTSSRRLTLGRSGAEPLLVTLRSLPGEPVDWDRVRQILLPALGFR